MLFNYKYLKFKILKSEFKIRLAEMKAIRVGRNEYETKGEDYHLIQSELNKLFGKVLYYNAVFLKLWVATHRVTMKIKQWKNYNAQRPKINVWWIRGISVIKFPIILKLLFCIRYNYLFLYVKRRSHWRL